MIGTFKPFNFDFVKALGSIEPPRTLMDTITQNLKNMPTQSALSQAMSEIASVTALTKDKAENKKK
jgi:hypothetical protein